MSASGRGRGAHPGVYALLILASAVAVFPLLWALGTSLKTSPEILAVPPRWIPRRIVFDHYAVVLQASNIARYFLNTALVTGASIVVTVFIACHAGYGAVRFRFPGRDLILFALLATAMIPGIALLAPLYALSSRFGVYDSLLGLVLVYSAWQVPTTVWLMRGFVESVPREIEESALIDGCSPLQVFYRVVLPLIRPGLAAAAIIVFVQVWNDFLIATALTISEGMRMLQVGLFRYISDVGIEWGRLMAYTMLSLAPILVAFVFLQRRFIQGLVSGATKG